MALSWQQAIIATTQAISKNPQKLCKLQLKLGEECQFNADPYHRVIWRNAKYIMIIDFLLPKVFDSVHNE